MLRMTEPPLAYGAMAAYPCTEKLKQQFTVESRFGDVLHLYEVSPDGKTIFLPRACCPIGPNDKRVDGHPIKIKSKITPKNEEQADVIDRGTALLEAGESFVLQAGTGKGKTVMSIEMICRTGLFTLIVATKDDLVKQWVERLLQFTDLEPKDIGMIKQDVCDVYGKRVVVASIKSLSIKDRYPASIRTMFGMVVFDEVHRLGAETFSRVARLFPARLRLGLSATPDRVDGKEVIFYSHIGPVRIKIVGTPMQPKVFRYKTGWLCPRQKNRSTGEIRRVPHSPGKCGHILKALGPDPTRNHLIVSVTVSAYKRGRRTVIFSNTIDHHERLESLLVKAGIPRSDIGHYYGTMSGKALDHAGSRKIILATPGKMGEGTDLPWLDTCVLASPLSNIEQIVGRVLREYPDKKMPVVFDLVDDDSPVFAGYARKRQVYYDRIKATVVEMGQYGSVD